MSRVMVVAPHPDDETLGCGGTLLRHIDRGDEVYWWIVTRMAEIGGFTQEQMKERAMTIREVERAYNFTEIFQEGFPSCALNDQMLPKLIKQLTMLLEKMRPDIIYTPFWSDVHSDHRVVAQAVDASCKPMRNPTIRCIRVYETLSETEQSFVASQSGFRPNTFIDISEYLEKKLQIMELYNEECEPWPFPRSADAIRHQAAYRGMMVGRSAAESFMTVREVVG